VTYSIIGDGEERKDLERLAAELGIEKAVRFLGWKTQDELIRIMENAHILIAPSVTAANGAEEGIPNVIKEAMAMGLPVVGSIHGGVPELITHGISGYLVEEKDVDALAERLSFLHDHSEIWSRLGRAGREKVERDFDIHKLNRELEELYRSIIKGDLPGRMGAKERVTRDRGWGTDGIL
jgi:colanic acid/amylovoran biosynthesis glycosyltransferase